MLRLSAKTIVIVATICFVCLVALQIVWMQSAWQNEKNFLGKAKKQFESELQSQLKQDETFKAGLKELLDYYNLHHQLDRNHTDWYYYNFLQAIQFSETQSEYGLDINGVSIARLTYKDYTDRAGYKLVSIIPEEQDSASIPKAGKLCIACILGLKEEESNQYNYQILLFYKDQWTTFLEKLGFLIFVALILLIVLGILFREMMRRYNQEKKLSVAKNDFINNLTHELQTPVFAIQMANRLISERTGEQPDIVPLTKIIEKETGQLKLHAGKILDLATLEQAQVEMNKEITDLNAFIEQRRAAIELLLQAKNGALKIKHYKGPLYCPLDQVHFNNVLFSLVDNAIKYSKDHPHITIETGETTDNMIYLRVSDHGIGIDRAYLPFIFDKFFRVPNIQRSGIRGFGLGLSYVKQIVTLHGGQIKISSEKDEGTTATISLPKAMVNA
jgi:signal transduction histidine kinase